MFRKPKSTIFKIFFVSNSKNHNIYCIFLDIKFIHRRFAGQAMYTWHWVTRLGLVKARAARATPVTPRHFCMAGVAQTEILRPVRCLCNCCRCPSSERLGRRTGACLTARQSVMQSMTPGARVLTQCGKKRMQMRGEPTFIWKNRDACVFLNCAVG